MKNKLILAVFTVLFMQLAHAQEEKVSNESKPEEKKLFDKSKLFTGGYLNFGFSQGYSQIGGSPMLGYSLTKFLDVAATINVNYISQRDNREYGDKIRQTIIGPGAMVRVFPVHFLFAQAQYEHSFIRLKYVPASGSSLAPETYKTNANSLLVGGGYTTGREPGGNSFYYLSILWDIGKDPNSPYLNSGNRAIPIIRGGINIGLFQGRYSANNKMY